MLAMLGLCTGARCCAVLPFTFRLIDCYRFLLIYALNGLVIAIVTAVYL